MPEMLSAAEQRAVLATVGMINTIIVGTALDGLAGLLGTMEAADSIGPLLAPSEWIRSDHAGRAEMVRLLRLLAEYRASLIKVQRALALVEGADRG